MKIIDKAQHSHTGLLSMKTGGVLTEVDIDIRRMRCASNLILQTIVRGTFHGKAMHVKTKIKLDSNKNKQGIEINKLQV